MPQIVDSRIDTVKLYHLGATIYRAITVEAVDGVLPDEIEVTGLPLSLHDATVRLTVDSPRGLLVASQEAREPFKSVERVLVEHDVRLAEHAGFK